jgi:hypothetical protein
MCCFITWTIKATVVNTIISYHKNKRLHVLSPCYLFASDDDDDGDDDDDDS